MNKMEKYPGYRKLETREHQLLQLEAMKHIHEICSKNDIQYYIIAGTILGAIRHGGFIPWDDDIDIAMMRRDYERFRKIFPTCSNREKYFLQHYDSDQDHRPALMRVCIKNTILDNQRTNHIHFCHNTFLDVFPLDNVPDDNQQRREQSANIIKLRKRINNSYYYYSPRDKGIGWPLFILKKLRAILNSIIYPKQLQRLKLIEIMTKYNGVRTECVCSMASGYSYDKQTMPRAYYGRPSLYAFEDTKFFGPEKAEQYLRHLYGDDYMTPRNKFKDGHGHDVYIKII